MIDIDDKVKAMFYLCNLAFTAVDTEGVCSFSSAVQFSSVWRISQKYDIFSFTATSWRGVPFSGAEKHLNKEDMAI